MIEAEVPDYIMLKPMPVQYCISKGAKTQACSIATWALEFFFLAAALIVNMVVTPLNTLLSSITCNWSTCWNK